MTETEKLRSLLNRARERMAYNFDRYACAACSHGVSKNECGCGFKRTGEMIDEIDKVIAEPVTNDYRRGAEAMREALAVDFDCVMSDCHGCDAADRADYIRAMPIPEDK